MFSKTMKKNHPNQNRLSDLNIGHANYIMR